MPDDVNEYRAAREAKRDALAKLGVNPYEVRTPERDLTINVFAEFRSKELLENAPQGRGTFRAYIRTTPIRKPDGCLEFDVVSHLYGSDNSVSVVLRPTAQAKSPKILQPQDVLTFTAAPRYDQDEAMHGLEITDECWYEATPPSNDPEVLRTVLNLDGGLSVFSPSELFRWDKSFLEEKGPVHWGKNVTLRRRAVAGRVLANRKMGKAVFLDVYDGSGRMQVYLNAKGVGDAGMAIYENIDLGDFIWVKGDVQRTRTGEVTLFAGELRFLTKALAVPPLPREFTDEAGAKHTVDALTDPELRHRRRYLDLMVHPEVRARFEQRSLIVSTIRDYLEGQGYLEVETPMMHPIPGGARARPFVTHHNALGMNLYLRIAPELYLKRLLVGGFERVFEINRNFRNEGIDLTHNPEFTMLELYEAYADYNRMMEVTEGMIVAAARKIRSDGNLKFNWNGQEVDLTPPFRRAKYGDLFREHAGFDMTDKARVGAEAKRLEIDPKQDYWNTVNEILEHHVEHRLIQPTFMIDYPTAICPLTKAKPDQPDIAERFELFICGVEFGNAFSELNEPIEQRRRFEEQVELGKQSQDVEAPKEVDYDYVEALEAGMPPAGGLGVGIDRLAMLLTGTDSIREVVLFPHMRREHVDAKGAAMQRAKIAAKTLLEELESPELRGHKVDPALKSALDKLAGE